MTGLSGGINKLTVTSLLSTINKPNRPTKQISTGTNKQWRANALCMYPTRPLAAILTCEMGSAREPAYFQSYSPNFRFVHCAKYVKSKVGYLGIELPSLMPFDFNVSTRGSLRTWHEHDLEIFRAKSVECTKCKMRISRREFITRDGRERMLAKWKGARNPPWWFSIFEG